MFMRLVTTCFPSVHINLDRYGCVYWRHNNRFQRKYLGNGNISVTGDDEIHMNAYQFKSNL